MLRNAIQAAVLGGLLTACSAYCPPGLKRDAGLSAPRIEPAKLIAKDEIEDGAKL